MNPLAANAESRLRKLEIVQDPIVFSSAHSEAPRDDEVVLADPDTAAAPRPSSAPPPLQDFRKEIEGLYNQVCVLTKRFW